MWSSGPAKAALKLVMDDIFRSFTTGTGQRVPDLAEPAQGVTIDPAVRGGFPGHRGHANSVHGCRWSLRGWMTSGEIAELYPAVTEADVVGCGATGGTRRGERSRQGSRMTLVERA